jgi:hypothetical protein
MSIGVLPGRHQCRKIPAGAGFTLEKHAAQMFDRFSFRDGHHRLVAMTRERRRCESIRQKNARPGFPFD